MANGQVPMTEEKVPITTYLTLEQKRALQVLSKNTRVDMALYFREAVDLILEKYKDKLSTEQAETQSPA